jgi:hypothetical protein
VVHQQDGVEPGCLGFQSLGLDGGKEFVDGRAVAEIGDL